MFLSSKQQIYMAFGILTFTYPAKNSGFLQKSIYSLDRIIVCEAHKKLKHWVKIFTDIDQNHGQWFCGIDTVWYLIYGFNFRPVGLLLSKRRKNPFLFVTQFLSVTREFFEFLSDIVEKNCKNAKIV